MPNKYMAARDSAHDFREVRMFLLWKYGQARQICVITQKAFQEFDFAEMHQIFEIKP